MINLREKFKVVHPSGTIYYFDCLSHLRTAAESDLMLNSMASFVVLNGKFTKAKSYNVDKLNHLLSITPEDLKELQEAVK